MENKILQNLKKELNHIERINENAPFPIFDTEHVEHVKGLVNEIKAEKIDYDDIPVHACGECGNLALKELDEGGFTTVCLRCGTVNNIIKYDTIKDWEDSKHGQIWKNL